MTKKIIEFAPIRNERLKGYDVFFRRIHKLVALGELEYNEKHITTTREIILTNAIKNLPRNYDFSFPHKKARVIDFDKYLVDTGRKGLGKAQ